MFQFVSDDKESFVDWDIGEKRFYIKADHNAVIVSFFFSRICTKCAASFTKELVSPANGEITFVNMRASSYVGEFSCLKKIIRV